MTDNEIIKALECCKKAKINQDCVVLKCPFSTEYGCNIGLENLRNEALDLINRQKAEIERLNIESETLATQLKGAYEQIHKLNMAKSEAMKEFAEELEYFVLNEDIEVVKPKCKDYESYINGANQFRYQIKNGINKLVKEMTE